MRLGVTFVAVLLLLLSETAVAQPELSQVSPAAAQPGTTVTWTLHGKKLNDPLRIWTSFPATIEIEPTEEKEPTSRTCRVTLPGESVLGVGGVVLSNPQGVSDVQLLLVDDVPTVTEAQNNHLFASPQVLEIPAAVYGKSNGTNCDYYRVKGKAGQRIAVEAVAARLGSNMDPVLRLLDSSGREILLVDDATSLGADCRFEYTFETDGDYQLELRDNRYRGGLSYRLRVGDFPLVSATYPLGGRLGSTARFQFVGPSTVSAQPVFVQLPEGPSDAQRPLSARFPDGKSSAITQVATSTLPEWLENEPNDAAKVGTPVTLPCAMNGVLSQSRDEDHFTFAAKAGQRMTFRAVARSLGSPAIPFLRLFDVDGKQLAETAVDDSDEFVLRFAFKQDGMYCLSVRDLLRRNGPDFAYRIEADPDDGFLVRLKQDNNANLKFATPATNGAVTLTLEIVRQGYDGPIELTWEDPQVPHELLRATVAEKAKEHALIVAAAEDSKAGDFQELRLLARPSNNAQGSSQPVDTERAVRAKFVNLLHPPAWMLGRFFAATIAPGDPVLKLPLEPKATLNRETGTATWTAKLERTNQEFKAAPVIEFRRLPTGFAGKSETKEDQVTLTLSGPPDAAPGVHDFRVVIYGEAKGQGRVVRKNLQLEIPAPTP